MKKLDIDVVRIEYFDEPNYERNHEDCGELKDGSVVWTIRAKGITNKEQAYRLARWQLLRKPYVYVKDNEE